jgi:hypothetical protein
LSHSFRGAVHGFLAPSLWVCNEAQYHGRELRVEQNSLPYGSQDTDRKTKRKNELRTNYVLQEHISNDLYPPIRPHLLSLH